MKHTLKITWILVGIFFLSQIIGLLIVNQYIDHEALKETGKVTFAQLPYDVERPPVAESTSVWYIMAAILIGTIILLIIIKLKGVRIWKAWYFLSVFITLTVAFASFLNQIIAAILAGILGFFKIFRPRMAIHNLTELFIYGGLAAIFVPIMNVFSAVLLLILISIYDMYAVWKSKHMVALANFTTESNVFAGLNISYDKNTGKIEKEKSQTKNKLTTKTKKVKNAILGGGDIGFPLLFAGVVMKELMTQYSILTGFMIALIIPLFTTVALLLLFMKGDKNKFYPAMPFLSIGCFLGYGIVMLISAYI